MEGRASVPSDRSPRVAIVDDEPAFREALESLLGAFGIAAVGFDSAEAFLAYGERGRLFCLLLDMQMPGLGGLALQERLVAEGERLPVIFISSCDDAPSRDRAMAAGALACLGKPFDRDELLNLLAEAQARQPADPAQG
jgi:FixJ family two-component response regulator